MPQKWKIFRGVGKLCCILTSLVLGKLFGWVLFIFYQHLIFSVVTIRTFKKSAPSRDGDEVSAPSRR